MCVCQPSPDSFTSEACSTCECFCVGCLNSPLFSLLILAAAACEAWANDNESKRLAGSPFSWLWVTVKLDLQSRTKLNNEILWYLELSKLNSRLRFIVIYWIADLNFCCRKMVKVKYCWWRNNQNHTVHTDAEHWVWHFSALGNRRWGSWMQLHLQCLSRDNLPSVLQPCWSRFLCIALMFWHFMETFCCFVTLPRRMFLP